MRYKEDRNIFVFKQYDPLRENTFFTLYYSAPLTQAPPPPPHAASSGESKKLKWNGADEKRSTRMPLDLKETTFRRTCEHTRIRGPTRQEPRHTVLCGRNTAAQLPLAATFLPRSAPL